MRDGIKSNSIWFDTVPDARKYPQLAGERSCDVVVVGGGIVGVTAALSLAEHGMQVVLLEKNHIATGDTGLTTGFLTRVPDASLPGLRKRYGTEFIKRLFTAARSTQKGVVQFIESERIECDFAPLDSYFGSYIPGDSILAEEWAVVQVADSGASLVTRVEDGPMSFPFAEAIRFADEGKFNARAYVHALLDRRDASRLTVYEESEAVVIDVAEDVVVHTAEGKVRARKVIMATGFPSSQFQELQRLVAQKITYVLVAKYDAAPLLDSLFWDVGDPYFYFRLVGKDSVMVGGCDTAAGEKTGMGSRPAEIIKQFTGEHFGNDFEPTHAWSGSIFHTIDGLPYAFAHPHYRGRVFVGCGLAGNGLVFGTMIGGILADLARGNANQWADLFSLERTRTHIPIPQRSTSAAIPGKKEFVRVANIHDVLPGRPLCAEVKGLKILIVNIHGKYFALSNTCSHAGGSLCDGELEGEVIQCPLHGGRFNVTTGAVLGPPPVRPQLTYLVQMVGDELEVELEVGVGGTQSELPGSKTLNNVRSPTSDIAGGSRFRSMVPTPWQDTWKFFGGFWLASLIFWLAQFLYQYHVLIPGEAAGSVLRASALTGATLIGTALFSSALFKWIPRWAQYWRIRRFLGVAGAIFIGLHIYTVYQHLYGFDIFAVYYSLDPFENPVVFGSLAYPIILAMALTSTDWAVQKLTPRWWKRLHRLVYVAYPLAIFHFALVNPALLNNPFGYLLVLVTVAAVFGQLYWFVSIASRKRFLSLGALVGFVVLALCLFLAYGAYTRRAGLTAESEQLPASEAPLEKSLEEAVADMKAYMEEHGGDPDIAETPLEISGAKSGAAVRAGMFENLNYMTSGQATLMEEAGVFFIQFENDFSTPNGPDLQVYLTRNSAPTERAHISTGVLLGKLKSTAGKQVYEIPLGVPIDEFRSVTIHCRAFNVPWSYARLE